jgi:hypothetical protein
VAGAAALRLLNLVLVHRRFDVWLATLQILEMLCDTPFPDTLREDPIEKTDRNAEIIPRYETGETGAGIARAYGISE